MREPDGFVGFGEEGRQRVLEQTGHQLRAWNLRRSLLRELANGEAGTPQLGQTVERCQAHNPKFLRQGRGDERQRRARRDTELQRETRTLDLTQRETKGVVRV